MPSAWEPYLSRWLDASLIDSATAERIREFESGRPDARPGLRWPALVAISLGALLLAAGVLLFVAAHWDQLGPWARFALVVLMLALLHAGGAAAAGRVEPLSIALHTVGTVALGAAIALTGQIFNLSEHWPSAVLLWAIGAALAWWVLGHWTQGTLVALLLPAWLIAEWADRPDPDPRPITVGVCLLAFTYLSAMSANLEGELRSSIVPLRSSLTWIGGIAVLPIAAGVELSGGPPKSSPLALTIAFLLPLAVAIVLRGKDAWMNVLSAVWVGIAVLLSWGDTSAFGPGLRHFLWWALGSVALAAWGIRDRRVERINLGMLGFALTVLGFYFSSVMDKLDRAAGLVGLGVLFLAGGWALEKTRRRLISEVRPA